LGFLLVECGAREEFVSNSSHVERTVSHRWWHGLLSSCDSKSFPFIHVLLIATRNEASLLLCFIEIIKRIWSKKKKDVLHVEYGARDGLVSDSFHVERTVSHRWWDGLLAVILKAFLSYTCFWYKNWSFLYCFVFSRSSSDCDRNKSNALHEHFYLPIIIFLCSCRISSSARSVWTSQG
jgi:hypothetical protein